MALENMVFQQEPFSYGWKDFCSDETPGGGNRNCDFDGNIQLKGLGGCWDSPPPSMAESVKDWETDFSYPDVCTGEGFLAGGGSYAPVAEAGAPILIEPRRRKRRRTKSFKSTQDMEIQRKTHIAVERNRRRQVNDYLAIIRSMMPPSHAQRGDQASIVGGAINFVKELEQVLQFLEGHKHVKQRYFAGQDHYPSLFANFFAFPQYATSSTNHHSAAERHYSSTIADIEVAVAENHASIKVLTRRHPKQLLKLLTGLHSVGLPILHLNVTTVDRMVLYSFSVKVEDNSQLNTVNEIATSVHEMISGTQEDTLSS